MSQKTKNIAIASALFLLLTLLNAHFFTFKKSFAAAIANISINLNNSTTNGS